MAKETLTQKVLFDQNIETERSDEPKASSKSKRLPNYIKIPLISLGIIGFSSIGLIGLGSYQDYRSRQKFMQEEALYQKKKQERQEYVLEVAKYKRSPNREGFSLAKETGEPALLFHDITFGPFLNMFSSKEDLTDKEKIFIEQYRKDHPEYKEKK